MVAAGSESRVHLKWTKTRCVRRVTEFPSVAAQRPRVPSSASRACPFSHAIRGLAALIRLSEVCPVYCSCMHGIVHGRRPFGCTDSSSITYRPPPSQWEPSAFPACSHHTLHRPIYIRVNSTRVENAATGERGISTVATGAGRHKLPGIRAPPCVSLSPTSPRSSSVSHTTTD